MKIFTVEICNRNYDVFLGHVIVANDEKEVIQLAKEKSAGEGKKIWNNSLIEEHGNYTGEKTEPFILMSDFNAA